MGTPSVIDQADELYRRRAEPQAVRESLKLLADFDRNGESHEAQWRLARALFFLGQEAESRDDKREAHLAGLIAGRRAQEVDASRVEGHFWAGVNQALYAEAAGGLKAARALIRARRDLARAIEISESYHGAGPLRVRGRLEHKAPRFLGGGRTKGRHYLERANRIAPGNTVTLIYLAELALKMGDRERAVKALEEIIAAGIDPAWEFENRRDKRLAREMLNRLGLKSE
ncbi:MAG TPA: TRAP transporter TatT component family protein [Blastocatellia bacterium]|nr:TRAP transporter TatT component family protein [Blastocatellia bacterium]